MRTSISEMEGLISSRFAGDAAEIDDETTASTAVWLRPLAYWRIVLLVITRSRCGSAWRPQAHLRGARRIRSGAAERSKARSGRDARLARETNALLDATEIVDARRTHVGNPHALRPRSRDAHEATPMARSFA